MSTSKQDSMKQKNNVFHHYKYLLWWFVYRLTYVM